MGYTHFSEKLRGGYSPLNPPPPTSYTSVIALKWAFLQVNVPQYYGLANTCDCEPVCPMLKQISKRMFSGNLRTFSSQSSQWYVPYPFVEYLI